jgi:1,4-alpha-glucan branching enzyme
MYKKNKISTLLFSTAISLSLMACENAGVTANESEAATESKTAVEVQKSPSMANKTAADLPHYLERDVQEEVFYFVMPDRFNNGNTDNDLGSKTQPISAGGLDKTHKGMFHGGDIQGLKDKLPYLKELGISAIWLTPILRNQAM